jgi:hypothetical protein
MKHLFYLLCFLATAYLGSCQSPEKERGDQDAEAPEKSVVQESKRKIRPTDIVVPDGYTIEAVAKGLSYPVDVT